jgi:hypothetical protein
MSHNRRPVMFGKPRQDVAKGPPQQAGRFSLDYASWRAHLAAPGSRFETMQSASPRIVHVDAATRQAVSTNDERHAA